MGAQKTLIQKTYEINICTDSINIDFLEVNRQSTDLNYLVSMIKVINIPQYMTVTTSKGKICKII